MLRTSAKIAGAIGLVLLALLVAAYLARDALMTRYVASQIDAEESLHCNHPQARVSASLERVTLSSLDCKFDEGPIASVNTADEIVVEFSGLTPRVVRVGKATMDQRERDVSKVECNGLAALANLVGGVTDSLMKGLIDGSESYSVDEHVTFIEAMTTKRAGKFESVMHGVRLSTEDLWNRTQAKRVTAAGPEIISVTEFDMRVKPSTGSLSAHIHVGKAKAGDEPDVSLSLRAKQLDQKAPQCELKIKLGG